jgi:hypothetical protein
MREDTIQKATSPDQDKSSDSNELSAQVKGLKSLAEQRLGSRIQLLKVPLQEHNEVVRQAIIEEYQKNHPGKLPSKGYLNEKAKDLVEYSKGHSSPHAIKSKDGCVVLDKPDGFLKFLTLDGMQPWLGEFTKEDLRLATQYSRGHEIAHCACSEDDELHVALQLGLEEKQNGLVGAISGSNRLHNKAVDSYKVYISECLADTLQAVHMRKSALDAGGPEELAKVDKVLGKMILFKNINHMDHRSDIVMHAATQLSPEKLQYLRDKDLMPVVNELVLTNAASFKVYKENHTYMQKQLDRLESKKQRDRGQENKGN